MQSRGVLYIVLSAFAFSIMSMLVKLVSERLPTGEIVLARSVLTLGLSYVMVRRANLSPWGTQRGRLVLRGLFGFGGFALHFVALSQLPLADATTLHFTQPLVTAVLAWWLLGERVGWSASFALACGFGGVMLVTQPGNMLGGGAEPIGVAIALTSAFLASCAYVTVRRLARSEHPLVIVFYFPLVATPLALPWAAADWVWPSATDWLVLLAIGAATQLGQVMLTLGLTLESAGRATSVGYVQIVFAILWQIVIFVEPPSLGTLAGAALIMTGTLAVTATARRAAPMPHTAT